MDECLLNVLAVVGRRGIVINRRLSLISNPINTYSEVELLIRDGRSGTNYQSTAPSFPVRPQLRPLVLGVAVHMSVSAVFAEVMHIETSLLQFEICAV